MVVQQLAVVRSFALAIMWFGLVGSMATVVSDCAPAFLVMFTVGFTVAFGAAKVPARVRVAAGPRVVKGRVLWAVPAAAVPRPVIPAPTTRATAAEDASSRTGKRSLISPPLLTGACAGESP